MNIEQECLKRGIIIQYAKTEEGSGYSKLFLLYDKKKPLQSKRRKGIAQPNPRGHL